MACNFQSDARIIDFILGNLDSREATILAAHFQQCHQCHATFLSWQETLSVEETMPSSSLKKRVFHSFKKKAKKKKWRFSDLKPITLQSAGLAVIGIALISIFLFHPDQSNPINHNESLLVMDDATDIYEFEPPMALNSKGYAMVNNHTSEIYLFIDGLSPIENKDFQAWIKTQNGLYNAGIIQLLDGKGQIYQQRGPSGKVEYIIVSLEPKGGSQLPSNKNSHLINVKLMNTNIESF